MRTYARPLRVALVGGSYHAVKDGMTLTLNRLVAFLRRCGVRVLVFAPAGKPAFAHQGRLVQVPSAPLPLRSEYRLALGLPAAHQRLMQDFAPDLIHLATPDLLGCDALRLGQRLGCPVVGSYHTRYESYLSHYGAGLLAGPLAGHIRRFYDACREVYVPSPSMAEALQQTGVGSDIRLWGRGVDAQRFNPAKRSQAWRAARGVGPDELVVAYVGRVVREKRIGVFAKAMRELEARGLPHRVLVVGDGPDRAGLQARLPRAVFTGFLDGEELATAYASADLFVFPSDTETFGSVTLEAMASGLPTLCANATGSRSLVDHEVTGFLEDAGDAAAFAGRIQALAANPGRRADMGEAARRRSLDYGWDEVLGSLLDRYEAVAAAA